MALIMNMILPIKETAGPIVNARITVPIVNTPPAITPTSIAAKSQHILTAKKGRLSLLLIIVGTESNGDSPDLEFIYKDTDRRKKNNAPMKTASLYGWMENSSCGRKRSSNIMQKSGDISYA